MTPLDEGQRPVGDGRPSSRVDLLTWALALLLAVIALALIVVQLT